MGKLSGKPVTPFYLKSSMHKHSCRRDGSPGLVVMRGGFMSSQVVSSHPSDGYEMDRFPHLFVVIFVLMLEKVINKLRVGPIQTTLMPSNRLYSHWL